MISKVIFLASTSSIIVDDNKLINLLQHNVYIDFIGIIYIISFCIVWYNLFKKAGQPGWAAIIPLYRTYIIGKIANSLGVAYLIIVLELLFFILYPLVLILDLYLLYLFYLFYLFSKSYNTNYLIILLCRFIPMLALLFLDNIQFENKMNKKAA